MTADDCNPVYGRAKRIDWWIVAMLLLGYELLIWDAYRSVSTSVSKGVWELTRLWVPLLYIHPAALLVYLQVNHLSNNVRWNNVELPAILLASLGALQWLAIAYVTALVWRKYNTNRQSLVGLCKECGYNLTGNVSGRCPECGTIIETNPVTPK